MSEMPELKISEEELQRWIDRKCVEKGCMNMSERGYIYCIPHLHGYPERLPEHVIEELKKRKIL